jgi:hypothetical protein
VSSSGPGSAVTTSDAGSTRASGSIAKASITTAASATLSQVSPSTTRVLAPTESVPDQRLLEVFRIVTDAANGWLGSAPTKRRTRACATSACGHSAGACHDNVSGSAYAVRHHESAATLHQAARCRRNPNLWVTPVIHHNPPRAVSATSWPTQQWYTSDAHVHRTSRPVR